MNATDHVDHYKKPRAWHWRPVRVAGQNAIGVYCGRRLVRVFGAHEVDDAHALCGLRNLAATAPSARYRLFGNNGQ